MEMIEIAGVRQAGGEASGYLSNVEPLGRVRRGLVSGLKGASGGWLAIALTAAPWMFGSTRHWAIIRLCELLSLMACFWTAGSLLDKRRLPVRSVVTWCVLFLLISGWLVTLSVPPLTVDQFVENHLARIAARWPGSVMLKSPVETMWLFTGLLFALVVTIDLSREKMWRTGLCAVMALTGASITVLGIVQIKTGATAMLWDTSVRFTGYFFGPFFQRTNAGAFINLVWPLSGALAIRGLTLRRGGNLGQSLGFAFWSVICLTTLSGLTAVDSKASHFNVVLMTSLGLLWLLWRLRWSGFRRQIPKLLLAATISACLLGTVGIAVGNLSHISERWKELWVPTRQGFGTSQHTFSKMRDDLFMESKDPVARTLFGTQRLEAMTCLRMIPQAGLLGFGPGTWTKTFPHFTEDPLLRTFLLTVQFAHHDFLQTVTEWGILGAAAWGVLIVGGLWNGLRLLRRKRAANGQIDGEEALTIGLMLVMAGVLIHGMIDFPLQIPSIQLYAAVIVGLLWAEVAKSKAIHEEGNCEHAEISEAKN